ncbi:MAG: hypothetical protein Phog2KO_51240 [Phototrophicaceae bacterium]
MSDDGTILVEEQSSPIKMIRLLDFAPTPQLQILMARKIKLVCKLVEEWFFFLLYLQWVLLEPT